MRRLCRTAFVLFLLGGVLGMPELKLGLNDKLLFEATGRPVAKDALPAAPAHSYRGRLYQFLVVVVLLPFLLHLLPFQSSGPAHG